jgi:ABC-type nitrate/sulfonate/bicarbonate transport system substrate-binding protein
VPDASSSNGIVTSAQKIKSSPDQVRRIVRASLKSLYDFRRNKASAIEFLGTYFETPKDIATRAYSNGLDILTPDGEISSEKVRQILSMMQDTGKKEAVTVSPASLIDFSFLREAQKQIK